MNGNNYQLSAKQLFEALGYKQTIYNDSLDGIQYTKVENEMERTGVKTTKVVEFYLKHKEIVVFTTFDHRDGSKTNSDCGVLTFDEFLAVQKTNRRIGMGEIGYG